MTTKIRSARRIALATFTTLTALAVALTPAVGFAKPKAGKSAAAATPAHKKSVALGQIEGKKSGDVRGWVRTVLQANFELTDAEDFKAKGDNASFMKLASDLGVEAVIVGKTDKNGVVLSVRDGADGKLLSQIDLKAPPGPKLKALINKRLPKKLYAAFGMESPADAARKNEEAKQEAEEASAEEESGGEDEKAGGEEATEGGEAEGDAEGSSDSEKASGDSEAAEAPASPSAPSPLELSLGLDFSKRTFAFHDSLNQLVPGRPPLRNLRDYNSGVDFALALRGEIYPGAFGGGDGFAANVGLVAGFGYGIPSKVVYKPAGGTQQELKNSVQDWLLGLKLRLPLGAKTILGLSWVYGSQKYYLKGDELNALVPDVVYKYTEPALDLRLALGRVFVQAKVGVRLVLDSGELEKPDLWFKNVGGRGIDGGLNLGFNVTPSLFVFGGVHYLRYGFDFNPVPTTAKWAAGGATDQFLGGTLGVGYRLPGTASGG